jgi:hypothetical protein
MLLWAVACLRCRTNCHRLVVAFDPFAYLQRGQLRLLQLCGAQPGN